MKPSTEGMLRLVLVLLLTPPALAFALVGLVFGGLPFGALLVILAASCLRRRP